MANEFKVKNGIKFPDNTIQTTAATGGGGGSSTISITTQTAAYTVVAGDLGKIINCTSGTFTVSLTAASTLGSGFNCWIWNTGTGDITIDPNASETIDGGPTIILRSGEGLQVVCDGSNWLTGDKKAPRGYAERIYDGALYAKPSVTGLSSIALGAGSSVTAANSIALGDSVTVSGTQSFGGGYNSTASGGYSVALGASVTASSTNSTAIGRNSGNQGAQAVTGAGATALSGSYAGGIDSLAAAIGINTSTYGANNSNALAMGYQAKSTGTASTSLGYATVSSGSYSTAIGYAATASGTNAVAVGGWWNYGAPTASATSAVAIGDGVTADAAGAVAFGSAAITNGIRGKYSFSSGRFASNGDSQTGTFVFRRTTTNGTATVITTDDTFPGSDDQIILPNNSAYAFSGILVARQQASAGTASAAWEIKGLIRREGSAATTVLVNSALTVINNAPGWTLALSADTTNGGLAITVTGAAATNIRWVATIQTSEVTY